MISTLTGIRYCLTEMKNAVKLVETAPRVRKMVGTQHAKPVKRLGTRLMRPMTPEFYFHDIPGNHSCEDHCPYPIPPPE